MSVRDAVEKRDTAPAKVSPQQAIKATIDPYRPVIAKLLKGTGVNEETFVAQIANACRATPELFNCDPVTVLGAVLKAAQLGLAPNDTRNLCWILPYKNRDKGIMEAQFQMGYGGIMELARRAEPGLRFDGRAVYPNDEFDIDFGREEPLVHRPAVVLGLDRGGDAIAWYVRAKFPDGSTTIHALDRSGVEYHRAFSKQPNGLMWSKSYDAAALKSVVTDMRRWLASSAQMVGAIASDEQVLTPDTIDIDPDESPELPPLDVNATEAPDDRATIAAAGVNENAVLIKARELAEAEGVDPPATFDEVMGENCPKVIADALDVWLDQLIEIRKASQG